MHHGEHLIDGKLDLTNLTCDRTTGSQKDVYICKAGENVYTPTFTYHGFQYVWGFAACARSRQRRMR